MFIEIIEPQLVDLQPTTDRFKVRIREKDAPGRLWINLVYNNIDEAIVVMKNIIERLEEGKANRRVLEYDPHRKIEK